MAEVWKDRKNEYNNSDDNIIITGRSRIIFFGKKGIITELEELEMQLNI
jgi:hypothetical protein